MGTAERSAALLFWRRVRMSLDWRTVVASAGRRIGLRNTAEGAVAGVGTAIAIGAMEWFSRASHYPLVIIPFATSIVLVFGSPEAEPAQPRALIGGHFWSAVAGLPILQFSAPPTLAAVAPGGVATVCSFL